MPHGGYVFAVAFSPLGDLLASGCEDKKLRVIRAATGAVEREVWPGGVVWAVAFHPQGDLIATGCYDGKLRVIRAALPSAVELEAHMLMTTNSSPQNDE